MTLQYTVITISLSHHYVGAYRHLIVWYFILIPSLSISESNQSINSILPIIRLPNLSYILHPERLYRQKWYCVGQKLLLKDVMAGFAKSLGLKVESLYF